MLSRICIKLLKDCTKNVHHSVNQSRHVSILASDLEHFRNILGDNNVKTEELDVYNQDWLHSHQGQSQLALFPNSNEQLSRLLSHCSSRRLPCVIQGGNTSLVAGAVPNKDEIIICMNKLNKLISFDATTGVLQCESGCILERLEQLVNESGYIMPYDLGAKGSCQIGGNLSTNAGGLRYIKYGSLHGSVLGIEVVLADGRIVDLMSSMRKDNTGYDLKHLFIGAEGTLGVITKVSIQCPTKPSCQTVALFSLSTFEHVIEAYQRVRSELDEFVSAFEMFDSVSLNAVTSNLSLSAPLTDTQQFYVLVELSANDSNQMEVRLANVVENLLANNVIIDGTYSSELNVMKKLWAYRERIAEALIKDGYSYKYDVSLPLSQFYQLVQVMRERLSGSACMKICGYGHLGDCNLHFNVTSAKYEKDVLQLIEPFIYEYISQHNGSISAEHGLGMKKRNYINFSKSPEAIALMKQIKTLFDPHGILCPNKLLPD